MTVEKQNKVLRRLAIALTGCGTIIMEILFFDKWRLPKAHFNFDRLLIRDLFDLCIWL
jgi:hypothetical protein